MTGAKVINLYTSKIGLKIHRPRVKLFERTKRFQVTQSLSQCRKKCYNEKTKQLGG